MYILLLYMYVFFFILFLGQLTLSSCNIDIAIWAYFFRNVLHLYFLDKPHNVKTTFFNQFQKKQKVPIFFHYSLR